MKTFFYQPGPAGSGKTHQLAHWAVDRVSNHEKVLIAQPTKELIRETVRKIRSINPNAKITQIYSRKPKDAVIRRVVQHMNAAAPHHGEVLFVTHETLKRLPEGMRQHWHMVCDEVPSVLEHIDLKIAMTHRIVTDYIDATQEVADGLLMLRPDNRAGLEAVQANESEDQNVASFERLVSTLLSSDHSVFMSREQWDDLTKNPQHSGHVDFFAVLMPEFVKKYQTVTFMGANITETELFVIWSALQDIDWKKHPDMSSKLRYQTHDNGHRLTICYLFDGVLSKRFLNQEDDEGTSNLDQVTSFVSHYLAGTPFLWQANKDANPRGFNNDTRLPGVAHGLDKVEWKSVHNVALLAAINRKSAAYGFLDRLGISKAQAQATLSYQNDYQAMMRCSLRDPDAIAPVRVIVGSREGAEWIQAKFPNAVVMALQHNITAPAKVGRPLENEKGPARGKDRTAKSRAKAKAAKAAALSKS